MERVSEGRTSISDCGFMRFDNPGSYREVEARRIAWLNPSLGSGAAFPDVCVARHPFTGLGLVLVLLLEV